MMWHSLVFLIDLDGLVEGASVFEGLRWRGNRSSRRHNILVAGRGGLLFGPSLRYARIVRVNGVEVRFDNDGARTTQVLVVEPRAA